MRLLIIAATKKEVEPLLTKLGITEGVEDYYFECKYKNIEISFRVTGVGMVATAYHTASMATESYYHFAINVGICGSFNKNLEIGTVVNVYEDCLSELGAEDGEEFLSLDDLKLNGITKMENNIPKEKLISNSVIDLLPKVNGITVNTAHGNEKSIEKVFNKFHPMVESMEGAAFMFVCEEEKMPYVQIRAVSNFVEKRNKDNWNIPLAIENLNKKILEILDAFN